MKLTLLLCLMFCLNALAALSDLKPEEIEKIKSGETIKRVIDLDGEPWPQVIMFKMIPHTPKQNMDVFTNYENHTAFVPDLISAKIEKKVSDNETHVAFKMDMPFPLGDSEYSTTNIVENQGDNYKLTWKLLKANQMEATTGSLNFEAFEGKTLFTYTNLVTPKTNFKRLVKLFRDRVPKDVETAYISICKHLNKTVSASAGGSK